MKTKNKFINYLKKVFFIIFFSFLIQSCQEENIEQIKSKGYEIKFLNKKDFKNNNIINKIDFFNKSVISKKNKKSIYSELYDFIIETENAFYVEYENGTYSYTFPITREIDNGATETFVLTSKLDGSLKAQYFYYNLTSEDLTYNGNDDFINISDKVIIVDIIDDDLILEVSQTKCTGCPAPSGLGGDVYGHWESETIEGVGQFYTTFIIDGINGSSSANNLATASDVCWNCDAGGSNVGVNNGTDLGSSSGGNFYNGQVTTPSFGNITLFAGLINNGISLGTQEITWINQSQNNADLAQSIVNYLNNNPNSQSTANEIFELSQNSPFNLDTSELVDNILPLPQDNSPEAVKLRCVYGKLTQSPKFKNLFLDVFGESSSMNVKFEISNDITENGETIGTVNNTTGEIDLTIKINNNMLDRSSIGVARTIIHEAIHAFLMVKSYNCNSGTTLPYLNNTELQTLINEYFNNSQCEDNLTQHDFMFEQLIPSISGIMKDIKDDIIPENNQTAAEDITFEDDTLNINESWNWDNFFYYFSMPGLHNTTSFEIEIENNPINNSLYESYRDVGKNSFTSNCN